MSTLLPRGETLGVAGGGLDHSSSWAANESVAKIGQAGELRTANLLDSAVTCRGGATVLHDLTIPGSRANIDHVVVSGRTVWVIDTKVWKPGVYWRLGERAYRGTTRFEPAEKKTTSLAVTRLRTYLERRGIAAAFATPIVVVWPSSNRERLSLALLRRVGDSPVVGGTGFRWAIRSMTSTRRLLFRRRRTADPALVAVLSELLVTGGHAASAPVERAPSHLSAVPSAFGFEDEAAVAPAGRVTGVPATPKPSLRLVRDPFGDTDDDSFGEF